MANLLFVLNNQRFLTGLKNYAMSNSQPLAVVDSVPSPQSQGLKW
jgi:hypothetical protein